jgi:hypothetical protein
MLFDIAAISQKYDRVCIIYPKHIELLRASSSFTADERGFISVLNTKQARIQVENQWLNLIKATVGVDLMSTTSTALWKMIICSLS